MKNYSTLFYNAKFMIFTAKYKIHRLFKTICEVNRHFFLVVDFQVTTKRINFIIDDSFEVGDPCVGESDSRMENKTVAREKCWLISTLREVYTRRYFLYCYTFVSCCILQHQWPLLEFRSRIILVVPMRNQDSFDIFG